MISITFNDMTTYEAKIKNEDGSEIKGIRAIDIRMRPDEVVTAKLDIFVDEINIQAEPLLSFNSMCFAARHYGYDLIPIQPDKE